MANKFIWKVHCEVCGMMKFKSQALQSYQMLQCQSKGHDLWMPLDSEKVK